MFNYYEGHDETLKLLYGILKGNIEIPSTMVPEVIQTKLSGGREVFLSCN